MLEGDKYYGNNRARWEGLRVHVAIGVGRGAVFNRVVKVGFIESWKKKWAKMFRKWGS